MCRQGIVTNELLRNKGMELEIDVEGKLRKFGK